MTNETKAALDRKRRFNAGKELSQDIYGCSTIAGINRCITKDDEILAQAYLDDMNVDAPVIIKDLRNDGWIFSTNNYNYEVIASCGKRKKFMFQVSGSDFRANEKDEIAAYIALLLNKFN